MLRGCSREGMHPMAVRAQHPAFRQLGYYDFPGSISQKCRNIPDLGFRLQVVKIKCHGVRPVPAFLTASLHLPLVNRNPAGSRYPALTFGCSQIVGACRLLGPATACVAGWQRAVLSGPGHPACATFSLICHDGNNTLRQPPETTKPLPRRNLSKGFDRDARSPPS